MSKKVIKGTIPFIITIEDGHVKTEYGSSAENDIGILASAGLMLRTEAGYFAEERDKIVGGSAEMRKKKEFYTNSANTFKKGAKAVQKILDNLLFHYDGYMEEKAEKDKKSEEIMEYLKKNATVEDGVLSPEEADRLLKEKYPDLASENKIIFRADNDSIIDYKSPSPDKNLTNLNENNNNQ